MEEREVELEKVKAEQEKNYAVKNKKEETEIKSMIRKLIRYIEASLDTPISTTS